MRAMRPNNDADDDCDDGGVRVQMWRQPMAGPEVGLIASLISISDSAPVDVVSRPRAAP